MIYGQGNEVEIPSVDLLSLLFDSPLCNAQDDTPLHAEASDPGVTLTKSDTRAISTQIAAWLRERYGIGTDGTAKDVVVTCSSGQAALPCLFYGLIAAGGIYSAASILLSADQLARQIKDGPCKLVVCSQDMLTTALDAAKKTGLPEKNVLILKTDPKPSLEAADGSIKWSYEPGQQQLSWKLITDPEELRTTTICLVYSSGTTGTPKGVRISHANMVSEAFLPASINRPVWEKWAVAGRPFASRTIAHLGCSHISGVQGYFVNPFFDGGMVYWMSRFDFPAFLAYNAALKITTFFSLPSVYAAVAKHPAVTNQLSSLRIAYSGGFPLNPTVYECAKFGGQDEERTRLSQTWGATETAGAATHMPPDRRDKTGSVGVLLPNMLMRLVGEDGRDVEPGTPGEAWLKGPIVTRGYHNNIEADNSAFKDGWYRTGDLVNIRGDMLYILGRLREMIHFRGTIVSPMEIEWILNQYPGVTDAAVIGVQWEDAEAPRALVVIGPEIEATKELGKDISNHVNDKVSDHQRLRGGVRFVPSIPRLLTGKICRHQLRQLASD